MQPFIPKKITQPQDRFVGYMRSQGRSFRWERLGRLPREVPPALHEEAEKVMSRAKSLLARKFKAEMSPATALPHSAKLLMF